MGQRQQRHRRRRLDAELVEQGFFSNAEDALRAVLAGDVSTTNRRLESPGEQVDEGIFLHVRGHVPYVSRGGIKLAHGLEHFGLDVSGCDCLDVGCSTGGFTDCLLRHGAASVLAVDVGYAQFDWSLRQDERVTLVERKNVVDLPAHPLARPVDVAVCDVSFTSVLTILPAVRELLRPGGWFLTLVKPQFEAPRSQVGQKGVVRDAAVRAEALMRVSKGLEEAGFVVEGSCTSPIRGRKGNEEYLLLGRLSACGKGAEAHETG
ncbi:MAG: TlyA family RNA methyltransferase [Coriobacteriales bacterium]|nr:TlyA family RNA methyltransferase [Coriobacteriales bacterium]